MRFLGGDPGARIVGREQQAGSVNYLVGSKPDQWRSHVPVFARVAYEKLYPGIDVAFGGRDGQLEFDFVVAPGASPCAIGLSFRGTSGLELDESGDLVLAGPGTGLRIQKPSIFQEHKGVKVPVRGRYVVREDGSVGFQVAAYDRGSALVIDPVVVYSTYLGGWREDGAHVVAMDGAGAAYVMGYTESLNFPIKGAYQPSLRHLFLTKFTPDGDQLVYSTYFGGTSQDLAGGIAVDAAGCVIIAGETGSKDLPLKGAMRKIHEGSGSYAEAFVTKFAPDGASLIFSTFLGGQGNEEVRGVAVDAAGDIYVAGATSSVDFPTVNAVQSCTAGLSDAFVAKLSRDGSQLAYATCLGGSETDWAYAIAVDRLGQAYVTGRTESEDFPIKRAFQPEYASNTDAFLAKLCPDGGRLGYSTYLGGSGDDSGLAVAVDGSGIAVVSGATDSLDYPIKDPVQPLLGGFPAANLDACVTAVMPRGDALLFSTFLGGRLCAPPAPIVDTPIA